MTADQAHGSDALGVLVEPAPTLEVVGYSIEWMVEKWEAEQVAYLSQKLGPKRIQARDFERHHLLPFEVSRVKGNLLTTAGLTRLTNLLTAGGGVALTNTTLRIGAGNGAGTAAVGDTDLSAAAGSSNRWFQIMDATFPSVSAAVLTAKSTFASADGNFAWNEFGMDISAATVASGATVGTTLFNHKTSIAQGTKVAGQVWAATATVTFS